MIQFFKLSFFRCKMAEKSIRFYKNLRPTDEHQILLELEINKIQTTLANNQIENQNKASIVWSDFMTKPAPKAILIGVILIVLNTYNGNTTLSSYTKHIFGTVTGSNVSTDLSAIIVAIIQVCLKIKIERSALHSREPLKLAFLIVGRWCFCSFVSG